MTIFYRVGDHYDILWLATDRFIPNVPTMEDIGWPQGQIVAWHSKVENSRLLPFTEFYEINPETINDDNKELFKSFFQELAKNP